VSSFWFSLPKNIKMKKINLLYYLFVLSFIIASCSGDSTAIDSGFSVDNQNLYIMGAPGTATFKIISDKSWNITVPSTNTWLTVSPTFGTGDATVTCSAAKAAYREKRKLSIALIPSSGTGKVVVVHDSLPNTAPVATIAAVYPTDGQTDVSDAYLHLNWEPSVDADGDKVYYSVDYSTDGSTWTNLGSKLDVAFLVSSTVTLTTEKKYYWRVTTYDMFGQKSPVSKTFTFTAGNSSKSWTDGEVRLYQACCNASATNPFTLIVTGDGFIASDFTADGYWNSVSLRAITGLLGNIEPYKTWGKYLRIIRIAAISEQSGVSVHQAGAANNTATTVVNTKFGSMYDNSSSSAWCGLYDDVSPQTGGSSGKVFNWVLAQLTTAGYSITKNYAILVIQNVSHYNGTVGFDVGVRSLGFVCISPGTFGSQTAFENVVCHEIGGHAIGHLADLYVSSTGSLSDDKKVDTQAKQNVGWYQNVSLVDDQGTCPWSGFFTASEYASYYSSVGLYAGARSVASGIWRPESAATCMNNNEFYYDAPSRYAIVKELTECTGESLTWSQFVAKDYDRLNSDFSSSRGLFKTENVPHLHEPITYKFK
jgi:hypothetical protein